MKKYILIIILFVLIVFVFYSFNNKKYKNNIASILKNNINIQTINIEKKDKSIDTLINNYLNDNNIDKKNISISYKNMINNETYYLNDNKLMFAASTYKLPLSMIYYENIYHQELTNEDTIIFTKNSIEDYNGAIYNNYNFGDRITISELLHESIVNSDNTAAHMLFENLGGWGKMIDVFQKYNMNKYEFSNINEFSTGYMLNVLEYLYNNQNIFIKLIDNMKVAEEGRYLQKNTNIEIAHKYGNYESANNDIGIVFSNKPYIIAIYTNLESGEDVISDINNIILNNLI